MNLTKFISDERGISSSVFKLALAVIIFAAVMALIVAVIKPIMDGSEKASDTTTETRKAGINNVLNQSND